MRCPQHPVNFAAPGVIPVRIAASGPAKIGKSSCKEKKKLVAMRSQRAFDL
jgi:hypothetical protein